MDDYRGSLDYLYGLQFFGIKLGLDNIRSLLQRLDHPERAYGVIHVGGSNGKGSVSAGLASVLRQAGFRVGLYTSPHLHSFTERIVVDGEPIPEGEVVRLTQQIRGRSENVAATFFEFTTAMALYYFQQQRVDFAVVEVGMGGRLDATNAVCPRLCVLTPVSLDHAEYLGPDLKAIAAEKVGILKAGVPVVCGRQEEGVLQVIRRRADELGAEMTVLGEDFSCRQSGHRFDYAGLSWRLDQLQPALAGDHQIENMAVVVAAAEVLSRQGVDIDPEAALRGVASVKWPGRLEWWQGQRRLLLDGAHNGAGANAVARYLTSLGSPRVRWVVGIKGDKQWGDILSPLLPFAEAVYGCVPPSETAVDPQLLVAEAVAADVAGRSFTDVDAALRSALADRRPDEVVLVAGSLFLVGAVRQLLSDSGAFPLS